jgi:uncharacterized protein (TIGR03437 family)
MSSPFSRRCALALAAAASVYGQATLARNPYLQNVTSTAAVVMWTTTGAAGTGVVRFSSDGDQWQQASSAVRLFSQSETGLSYGFYQHRAQLTGLKAATSYRYEVLVDGATVSQGSFATPGPGAFTFLAFGDSGDGQVGEFALAREILKETPALVLHLGDLAYDLGTYDSYEKYYFAVYRDLMARSPFFPVPGNHDYYFQQAAAFRAVHETPSEQVPPEDRGLYYSFDWGPVHFIALDSNRSLAEAAAGSGKMLDWLRKDLSSTHQLWRVAYYHHNAFPVGNHVGDPECQLAQAQLAPILEREGVNLVLSGHEHAYEKTRARRFGSFVDSGPGTVYITSGGAGSAMQTATATDDVPLALPVSHYLKIDVSETGMRVRAISEGQRIIDDFTLSPAPYIEAGGVRDSAEFSSRLASGGLFSIFGFNLADGDSAAASVPAPRNLGGTSVELNLRPVPLLFASRTQVNGQMPFNAAGSASLTIRSGGGVATTSVQVSSTAPAVFGIPQGAQSLPALIHSDSSLVTPANPAVRGEWLSLFVTGLGPVQGNLAEGAPAPVAPLLYAAAPPELLIAGQRAPISFSGLAPGFIGLNQINFQVPASTPPNASLTVVSGSASQVWPFSVK